MHGFCTLSAHRLHICPNWGLFCAWLAQPAFLCIKRRTLSEQGSRQLSAFLCIHQPDGFKDLLTGDFCCRRLFVLPGLGCCRGQVLGVEVRFDLLCQFQPGLVLRVSVGVHQDRCGGMTCIHLDLTKCRVMVTMVYRSPCMVFRPPPGGVFQLSFSGSSPGIPCRRSCGFQSARLERQQKKSLQNRPVMPSLFRKVLPVGYVAT